MNNVPSIYFISCNLWSTSLIQDVDFTSLFSNFKSLRFSSNENDPEDITITKKAILGEIPRWLERRIVRLTVIHNGSKQTISTSGGFGLL